MLQLFVDIISLPPKCIKKEIHKEKASRSTSHLHVKFDTMKTAGPVIVFICLTLSIALGIEVSCFS